MEENKKYTGVSIPLRQVTSTIDQLVPKQSGSSDTDMLTDTVFAEVEYEPSSIGIASTKQNRALFSTVTPSLQIGQRTIDKVRQKFYDMRSLASGNLFARTDAKLFYKQAKFMENFSDDYQDCAQLSMYYPRYQNMGYEQLRTYFTWRTKVRDGEILPTSLSYVFLYVYELLSNIGVNNSTEGLDKLMTIWNVYRAYEPVLDNYLPRWMKDYHIYYQLPHNFEDFVNEHNLKRYYTEQYLFDTDAKNSLFLWNTISSYDITKSKFYNTENETLLKDCFYAVLCSIREYCTNHKVFIEDLLSYRCEGVLWHPFRQAIFYHWYRQSDREVEMPGQENYYCKENRWVANISIQYSHRKEFAGYLIKKTEMYLRQAVKYKYKITVNTSGMKPIIQRLKKMGISFDEMDNVIEKAVADFHRDLTRIVVTVDQSNLTRIRKEALGTQEKLIVPEDDVPYVSSTVFVKQHVVPPPEQSIVTPVPVSDGFNALKEALNKTELEALSILLQGGMGIKAFADENGVMLEVLADGINEKAVDHIGDNILECMDSMTIYEEYKKKVMEMV